MSHNPRSFAFAAGAVVFAVGDLLRRTVDAGLTGPVALSRAAHDHAAVWQSAALAMIVGSVLMLPLVARVVAEAAGRGRLPLRIGGSLFVAGLLASVGHAAAYFGLASVFGSTEGLTSAQLARLDHASESQPLLTAIIVVFIAGMLLGQLTWAVGLWRSGAAPVWLLPVVLVEIVAGGTGSVGAGLVGLVAWIGVGLIVGGFVAAPVARLERRGAAYAPTIPSS
jgi:hypothetical protein